MDTPPRRGGGYLRYQGRSIIAYDTAVRHMFVRRSTYLKLIVTSAFNGRPTSRCLQAMHNHAQYYSMIDLYAQVCLNSTLWAARTS